MGIQIGVKTRVKTKVKPETVPLPFVVLYPCSPMIKLSQLPKSHQQTCYYNPPGVAQKYLITIFVFTSKYLFYSSLFTYAMRDCATLVKVQVKYSQKKNTICTSLICLMGLVSYCLNKPMHEGFPGQMP